MDAYLCHDCKPLRVSQSHPILLCPTLWHCMHAPLTPPTCIPGFHKPCIKAPCDAAIEAKSCRSP